MLLLLDYKFILLEFGIFKTRNGILYSWKVVFVDYTQNSSAFLLLFNFITFMDFQNVKLDWSVCTCLTQLYDGRDVYRIY